MIGYILFFIWYVLVFLGVRRIAKESVRSESYVWSDKDEIAAFFWPIVLIMIALLKQK